MNDLLTQLMQKKKTDNKDELSSNSSELRWDWIITSTQLQRDWPEQSMKVVFVTVELLADCFVDARSYLGISCLSTS